MGKRKSLLFAPGYELRLREGEKKKRKNDIIWDTKITYQIMKHTIETTYTEKTKHSTIVISNQ